MSHPDRGPGIRYPPPAWFILLGVGGWLLDRAVPAPVAEGPLGSSVSGGGIGLILAGGALLGWALLTFARARTGIYPHSPASQIVATGPYRLGRNPMYAALAVVTVGAGLMLNSWWVVGAAPLGLLFVYRFVVRREEAYLAGRFPVEYAEYRRRVRRWL